MTFAKCFAGQLRGGLGTKAAHWHGSGIAVDERPRRLRKIERVLDAPDSARKRRVLARWERMADMALGDHVRDEHGNVVWEWLKQVDWVRVLQMLAAVITIALFIL